MKLTLVMLVVAMFVTTLNAYADADVRGYEMTIGADLAYGYLWRGIPKHTDSAVQPYYSINIDAPDISFDIWTNIMVSEDDDGNSGEMTEAYFSGDYAFGVADFWVTIGGIYYNYLSDITYSDDLASMVDDTTEVYVKFEWLGGIDVTPMIALFYDVDQADGAYGQLGFTYQPAEYDDIEYGLHTALGFATSDWNNYYFGVDDSSFVNFDLGVFMDWMINDNAGAKVNVDYATLIDSEIQDATDSDSTLTASVGIYLDF
jgi:hypothetical protein